MGVVFIIGSAYFQFSTEQQYIARSKDIAFIQQSVKDPSSYFQRIATNDPIYIADTLHRPSDSKPPSDRITGVSYDAFVVHREMEMYQWRQHEKKETERSPDGTEERDVTTYSYSKQWSSAFADSARFKYPEGHYNPQHGLFQSCQGSSGHMWSSTIHLGSYPIAPRRFGLLLNGQSSSWTDITQRVYDDYFASNGIGEWRMKHSFIYYTNTANVVGESYHQNGGEPNVGDVRMRWTALNLEGVEATFLGALDGMKRLDAHVAVSENDYIYLQTGRTVSVQNVIASFHEENNNTLWLWRGLTLLFMCLGFVCLSSIVTYLASWIPVCGGLIGCGVNCAAALLGMVVYTVVFIMAYFSARKEIAVALIVAVVIGLVFMQNSGARVSTEDQGKSERKEGEIETQ